MVHLHKVLVCGEGLGDVVIGVQQHDRKALQADRNAEVASRTCSRVVAVVDYNAVDFGEL